MRKIGLIGGVSCEATALYYERINASVRSRLGGLAAGDMIVSSPNFEPLIDHRRAGAFETVATLLADDAERLVRAGADVILICADPMRGVAAAVAARIAEVDRECDVEARLVDAAVTTLAAVKRQGHRRPLLLSMQDDVEHEAYAEWMRRGGVEVRLPSRHDREAVRHIVLNELCAGLVRVESRTRLLDAIERGIAEGADCVILACPELSMVLDPDDLLCPGFDSAAIHAEAAVEVALGLSETSELRFRSERQADGAADRQSGCSRGTPAPESLERTEFGGGA